MRASDAQSAIARGDDLVVTGVGVVCAIGLDVPEFLSSLRLGRGRFGYLDRDRRTGSRRYIGAEVPPFSLLEHVRAHAGRSELARRCEAQRHLSLSGQLAILATLQAWIDADLPFDPHAADAALIVAGTNLQQRANQQAQRRHQQALEYVRGTYGMTFFDTDVLGAVSDAFGLRGEGCTVGGGSASGNLAIIHGARLVREGHAPVAVVVGALTDLSEFELQGLAALGALGSHRFTDRPELACRPFDMDRDGFIYGEGSGSLVIETRERASARRAKTYGAIAGYAASLDGTRGPSPSIDAEERVMRRALDAAGVRADAIDYINTHGTGSIVGDEVETAAIRRAGLECARLNATKSLTGHLLSAAGVVECIATLLQMREGFVHATRNLNHPVDEGLGWIDGAGESREIRYALSNSFAFGGINSSILLRAPDAN
jgi:malonyl-ACP decarboxylase